MKVAYVIHRYGKEVRGGAEQACRLLAEHLTAATGWPVEVFTTCARDGTDWADEYPPGDTVERGVTVHRFRSVAGRDPGFEPFSARVLPQRGAAPVADQERWVDLQGPVSPDLLAAAGASDADVLVFCPYLYWPTVRGVPRLHERAVMHPAAHDELPIRLPLFRSVFGAARGFAYFTDAERRLVERMFPVASRPQAVIGLGVDVGTGDRDSFRRTHGLADRPYLLCLGRVDNGKGASSLAAFFAAYKRRHPGPLALAFVGPVVHEQDPHPDILVTGPVDEALKWGALSGARALVSPSPFESFALVLMEAWSAGTPVVVNARCDVTREHCERSSGGLWFDGYASFEAVLDRLLGDERLAQGLARRGKEFVERHYRWPVVIERYRAFLTSLV